MYVYNIYARAEGWAFFQMSGRNFITEMKRARFAISICEAVAERKARDCMALVVTLERTLTLTFTFTLTLTLALTVIIKLTHIHVCAITSTRKGRRAYSLPITRLMLILIC